MMNKTMSEKKQNEQIRQSADRRTDTRQMNTKQPDTNTKRPNTKTTDNTQHKKKNGIVKVLLSLFIIGMLVCVVIIVMDMSRKKKAEDTYSDLQDRVNVTTQADGTGSVEPVADDTAGTTEVDKLKELGITIPDKNLDWDALHAENADIYAWIYIPGTGIDYPILQHPTEQDYYLDHNLDGSTGYPGCIYTQIRNSKDFTDFATILYGHNMKDGTMFQNLHDYEDKEFFDANPYIYIYTPDKTFVYQIFAAVTFHDRNILLQYDMTVTGNRAGYINDIKACNGMSDQHNDDVTVNTESRIVSLSTCIGASPDKRWIVSGVLLN